MIVGGLLAGGLLLGSGVALADDGGGTPGGTDTVCTQRIPKALDRIDTMLTRIDGGASTKGSTAWLKARADRVRTTHPALADLLDQRAAARPAKVQELQTLRSQLQDVQRKDCA
ncbi:hypothetical protein GCM10023175_24960 [Pseudonocardia xishanensis]|uniref:Hemophore-related protein n=2 Tax=Pseudonocardia xishanensis TaxID=630995 RepID=A0ABP8RRA2_9PSEU